MKRTKARRQGNADSEIKKITKLKFKPWKSRAAIESMLTAEEFDRLRRIAVLASHVMLKNETALAALAERDFEAFKASVAGFDGAAETLDALCEVIKSASARMFVAAAKMAPLAA